MCPHTPTCVLILLCVSSYYYSCTICPHTTIFVLSLLCVLILLYVSSYYMSSSYYMYLTRLGSPGRLVCVLRLLYVSAYYYMYLEPWQTRAPRSFIILLYTCPHTAIRVLILLHVSQPPARAMQLPASASSAPQMPPQQVPYRQAPQQVLCVAVAVCLVACVVLSRPRYMHVGFSCMRLAVLVYVWCSLA
jgi:hypothetical protein